MPIIKKILHIYPRNVKIRLWILLIAIIFGAMLETIALSVVYPFITLLTDNTAVENPGLLSSVYAFLSLNSYNTFLGFLALVLGVLYAFKSVYLFFLSKIQYRFISNRQIELSDRLLREVLKKPYLYHMNKNIADFQRIIITDVTYFTQLITNVLLFAADIFMCLFIVVFLLVQSPMMTLAVVGLAFICILFYFKVYRSKVKIVAEVNRTMNVAMTKAVNQALGGIKELKISRKENYFSNQFKKQGDTFAVSNQKYQVYGTIPKLITEAVCFSGAFVLIAIMIFAGTDMENTIPLLSLFVLAAFRLLPAIARFSGCLNMIMFTKPSVDNIYNSLFENDSCLENVNKIDDEHSKTNISDKVSSSDIVVDNIFFNYPGTDTNVLDGVSLCIPNKKSVAFIGETGEGKTTLVDVIIGIYTPQNGKVYYNGKSIHKNFDEWAQNIGYIPQHIYLLDETIKENVAYGIEETDISENRIWESLEQAQLANFVRSLPDGINTIVGDRGVRLSGGQRQRIGIARALYTNPSILVLDEATSSLDNETEKAVMEAIERFQEEKTMIIIAHRLSTIEKCDIIYRVEGGKVVREK